MHTQMPGYCNSNGRRCLLRVKAHDESYPVAAHVSRVSLLLIALGPNYAELQRFSFSAYAPHAGLVPLRVTRGLHEANQRLSSTTSTTVLTPQHGSLPINYLPPSIH